METSASPLRTLRDLRRGETGVVSEVLGDDAIAIRLMEMGLIEGETVELITFAPLGDPIEYEIRGYRLSLRGAEAARVRITPASSSDS